ncbi:potassium channel family protein [Streptomyces flavofungini]|uniref:potassium channel family protein n=1 Tax=Streptomyces flavofungini TaxID=68200 RepID=UPI003F80019B
MTRRREGKARPWHRPVLLWAWATATVTAYFLVPLRDLGPQRPVLSWLVLIAGLTLVAAGLLVQILDVLADRTGTRPGWIITGLMCLTVLLFSSAYYVLAQRTHEFSGLRTRLDALYFTVVTLTTIGYGDISPRGQTARALTLLQIVYGLIFLTAGATALTRQIRVNLMRRARPASSDEGSPDERSNG